MSKSYVTSSWPVDASHAYQHALVIGGGMAGLLAARVLTDHFDRVTLVERDLLLDGAEFRPGVPQSRHVHAMRMRGMNTLESLFPGITGELVASGATIVPDTDFRILFRSGWSPRVQTDTSVCDCTRGLLEATIRRRIAADRRVRLLAGHEVVGLLPDSDETSVIGACIRTRGHSGSRPDTEEVLTADLIVDAGGRRSRAPEWLEALGYAGPAETVVDARVGYTTRLYRPPAGWQADWKRLLILLRPPHGPRGGVLLPVEGGRWLVTLVGAMGDYPPTDEAGFLEFARSLSSPLLYEAIRDAEPVTPIYGYRQTENRRLHYEQLARWPERFAVIGDAFCAFNPVYGQGMTVCALEAQALDQCLRRWRRQGWDGLKGLSRHLQKRFAHVAAGPWAIATSEDLRWPTTQGGRITARTRFIQWYMDQVIGLIPDHPGVYRRFLEVTHMLRPGVALFRSGVLLPVLKRALRPAKRAQTSVAAGETAYEQA
jgi:2-polyprenyl-6-methoxyphenol hydroxylase-like FAD-dependent oxidoreductase